jgi:hypothetical protein
MREINHLRFLCQTVGRSSAEPKHFPAFFAKRHKAAQTPGDIRLPAINHQLRPLNFLKRHIPAYSGTPWSALPVRKHLRPGVWWPHAGAPFCEAAQSGTKRHTPTGSVPANRNHQPGNFLVCFSLFQSVSAFSLQPSAFLQAPLSPLIPQRSGDRRTRLGLVGRVPLSRRPAPPSCRAGLSRHSWQATAEASGRRRAHAALRNLLPLRRLRGRGLG